MLQVFQRFESEEILSAQQQDPFASDHPAPADRIAALQALVDASPYRDKRDSAEAQYAFDMMQAKLRGYVQRPDVTLRQYPETDTSKPARYARAMAYLKLPDMAKAQAEISSLLAEEPENPYFLEMMGDIKVQLNKVADAIEPYEHAVHILPDAPLIRVSLGSALLGTENPKYVPLAEEQLETALQMENDNPLAWYELAEAYNRLGLTGKAELATAERYFAMDAYPQAMQFAYRAQRQLSGGSTEWQRASDIMAIAQAQIPNHRN
jgi:predicted Zn-dependent protease